VGIWPFPPHLPPIFYWLWDIDDGQLIVHTMMPLDGVTGEVSEEVINCICAYELYSYYLVSLIIKAISPLEWGVRLSKPGPIIQGCQGVTEPLCVWSGW
jgi:hypothetical protein